MLVHSLVCLTVSASHGIGKQAGVVPLRAIAQLKYGYQSIAESWPGTLNEGAV